MPLSESLGLHPCTCVRSWPNQDLNGECRLSESSRFVRVEQSGKNGLRTVVYQDRGDNVPIVETSMNFDLGTLRNILERISKRCPRFNEREVADALSLVSEMKQDETRHHNAEIDFNGKTFHLGFEFSLSDIDAPDVRFWGTNDFVAWLESEYDAMCEELGI